MDVDTHARSSSSAPHHGGDVSARRFRIRIGPRTTLPAFGSVVARHRYRMPTTAPRRGANAANLRTRAAFISWSESVPTSARWRSPGAIARNRPASFSRSDRFLAIRSGRGPGRGNQLHTPRSSLPRIVTMVGGDGNASRNCSALQVGSRVLSVISRSKPEVTAPKP